MKYQNIPPSREDMRALHEFYKQATRPLCSECEPIYDESGITVGEAAKVYHRDPELPPGMP